MASQPQAATKREPTAERTIPQSLFSSAAVVRTLLTPKIKGALRPLFLAEGEGFEPPEAFTSTVFKTAAFDRSAILPYRPPEKGSRFLLFQSAFSPTPRRCRAFKSSSLAAPRLQHPLLSDASRGRRAPAFLRPSACR